MTKADSFYMKVQEVLDNINIEIVKHKYLKTLDSQEAKELIALSHFLHISGSYNTEENQKIATEALGVVKTFKAE